MSSLSMLKRKKREEWINFSFVLPSMIGILIFSMIPLAFSLYVSLTDWNFISGLGNWNFVGLDNFRALWSDEWFIASLKNTVIYTIITVPVSILLALVLAVLIDDFCSKKLAGILRVSMYMPHICNIVATSAVWMALYSSYGPFTQMIRSLGWNNPPTWLYDYQWSLPALMLVSVWSTLGYRIFIFSSGLQSLPRDVYEAAEIDGANWGQKFIHLTVPLIRPTTFFLTITGILNSFKVFGIINVMTKGGPGHSTYTLVFYIYKAAFSYYKMGYASSIAVVLFLILLVLTLFQWKHNEKNTY